jgi:hypothetical protein
MAEYKTVIIWNRNGATFTDNGYSRGHRWLFDGGIEVPASSSPYVVPLPLSVAAAVDPEEAFVASLSRFTGSPLIPNLSSTQPQFFRWLLATHPPGQRKQRGAGYIAEYHHPTRCRSTGLTEIARSGRLQLTRLS